MELLPQSTQRSQCARGEWTNRGAETGGKRSVAGGSSQACLHMQRHMAWWGGNTPSHKAGWAYGLHFTDINIYIS